MALKVVMSAGEVSGDRHLSKVVAALKSYVPECRIRGMAGPESEKAGAELLIDCYKSGATMGFSEIAASAGKILRSFKTMANLIREWHPDVVILVDYPDFNLRLAKVARKAGCKVFYYIPPKVWAWRTGRVKLIKEVVDHIGAIFPFEKDFYAKHGYSNVTYVGNPLGDRVGEVSGERSNTLLMLPGSRKFEVKKILPPMLRVFERLRATRPNLLGRVIVAPNMSEDDLRANALTVVKAETVDAISWAKGDALEEMKKARAGILKSGTCNLEGAVAELPFVSVYSGSWVSKVITSALVPLTEFSPVNIMRSKTVSEVFAVTIDEDALEREVSKVLDQGSDRERVAQGIGEVKNQLRGCDERFSAEERSTTVPHRVASIVIDLAQGRLA